MLERTICEQKKHSKKTIENQEENGLHALLDLKDSISLLLGHWYEIMALYYVKLMLKQKSQLLDKIEGFCKKAKSSDSNF